jgi:tetratricopeptide (TPR) repeat protein
MPIRYALAVSMFGLIGICQSPVVRAQEADESALDEGMPKLAPIALEAPGALELQEAMRRIALRPTDADALADAGNASLLLGDANAALNFFTRANALQPGTGRIKAGLGAATVRTENPFEALRLFDEAIKLGVSERTIAADRALAYDLLGNFERAQLDYKLASTAFVSDNLIIQQAISLSLLGRTAEADGMLVPLLKKENPSAWRARAFILAARGDLGESERVAQSFLDIDSARRVERYLRLMPQLTNAQQAAAIHLGHFPANNIGRDSDAVRTVAATIPPVPATGPGRLIPSGKPLGPKLASSNPIKESSKARKAREKAEKLAAATPKPGVTIAASTNSAAGVPLPNAIAKARIEEASRASMTLLAMRDLPPPDTARPLVKVALPSQTETTPASVPPILPALQPLPLPLPKPVPIPAPAPAPVQITQSQPVLAPQTSTLPVPVPAPAVPQPVIIASPAPTILQPQPLPQPLPQPAATQAVVIQPVNVPAQIAIIPPAPATPVVSAIADAAPIVTPATVPVPAPVVQSAPADIAAPLPSPLQGPQPDGSIVKDAPEIIFVSNAPPVVVKPEEPAPKLAPPSETTPREATKSFDLGSIVNAIEIPASEQKRTTAAVDLKKLKPTATKPSPEEAKAAAIKAAAAKGKPGTKIAANPARYWVQIATGDKSAIGFDFRNWARKKPDLFKGLSGWSAPWSKSSRLLVGPFDDMKVAKKWEADFRKGGGDGYVWKSEEGAIVEPVKGK